MMRTVFILLISNLCTLGCCTPRTELAQAEVSTPVNSISEDSTMIMGTLPPRVGIEEELLYDKYALEDTCPYKDTARRFQWEKMKERLSLLESTQREPSQWVILRDYRNRNGEAPLIEVFKRDVYKRVSDTLGAECYQSVPLYLSINTVTPEIYGRDSSLIRIKAMGEDSKFTRIQTVYGEEEGWYAPRKYVGQIEDAVVFDRVIFMGRHDQDITTLECIGSKWSARNMDPATTGQHRPPYTQEAPLGMYILQEKKSRMTYLVDGSKETDGFVPYANHFTNGVYVHDILVNAPRRSLIRYSPSLGTVPRSHMYMRDATSHTQLIYGRAPVNGTIVSVLE